MNIISSPRIVYDSVSINAEYYFGANNYGIIEKIKSDLAAINGLVLHSNPIDLTLGRDVIKADLEKCMFEQIPIVGEWLKDFLGAIIKAKSEEAMVELDATPRIPTPSQVLIRTDRESTPL